ncbi:hypothetical protein KIN20_037310 [Parelaphostrongylus tenuis]|uniref:Uncharacterized protein n=1 Tax=Parelaphostrongylus tenuis TaxID=148309 RepID=A0AAD5REF0_PARTN|nr:hypothetical protein KIN20_037310 [Parelaphostrongylus tenuis]
MRIKKANWNHKTRVWKGPERVCVTHSPIDEGKHRSDTIFQIPNDGKLGKYGARRTSIVLAMSVTYTVAPSISVSIVPALE